MSENENPSGGGEEPTQTTQTDPVATPVPTDVPPQEESKTDVPSQEESKTEAPIRQNLNVSQEYPSTEEHDSLDKLDATQEILPVLSHTRDYVTDNLDGNIEAERQDTPNARRWHNTFEEGFSSLALGGQFEAMTIREGAQLRQYLDTEKGRLGFSSPKFGESGVAKVSGEKAVLRTRALLGLGGLVTIPLWHSGFHITIKAPSDSSLIELRRRLMEEKITLGRHTHGLAFSNVSSYVAGWLLDFVLDHVYETTLKNSTDLRKKIKTPDLPVLFWGLACAIWPKGFQYVRALATEEGMVEKRTVSGKINVSKLMWVDNTAFTKQQKAQIAQRQGSATPDEALERYREDFPLMKGRSVEINEFVTINLGVPSADEYIRSGQLWLNNLMSIVEGTFTEDREDVDRRNMAIAEHANATIVRQYGHWVENIVIEGAEQTDRETIDSILETISEDADARKIFHEAVGKYIDDVTVAIVAIPEVSKDGSGLERFPNLIPLDVISVFFTLLMQRVNRILTR